MTTFSKFLAVLCLAVLALVGGGCGSLDKEFVDRMDAPAAILLLDLEKAYRGEALGLDAEQVARRQLLLKEWRATIAAGVKATR